MGMQIDITNFCEWAALQVYNEKYSRKHRDILKERIIAFMHLASTGATLTRTYYGYKQVYSTPHNRWLNLL